MLPMIGAFLPTGLLAAFFHWIFRKLGRKVHRAVVHGLSWITCSALWVLGSADGAAAWTFDRFLGALALYFIPQTVWFIVETVRSARVTATGPLLVDDGESPAKPHLESRRQFSRWAGDLHGGQLVMLIVLVVPIALALTLTGIVLSNSAHEAKKKLIDGDYLESPSNVELAGVNYRASKKMDSSYVSRLKYVTDSLKIDGQSDYDIEELVRQAELPLTRSYFTEPRSDLQKSASRAVLGLFSLAVGCLAIVSTLATMWIWFGARGRKPRTMTADRRLKTGLYQAKPLDVVALDGLTYVAADNHFSIARCARIY
jgi:hypothetical protein